MYCANCGKEIADNTKFCPNCGMSILMDNDPKGSEPEKAEEKRESVVTDHKALTNSDKAGIGIIGIVVIVGIVVVIALFAIAVVKSMTNNNNQPNNNTMEVVEEAETEAEVPDTWLAATVKDDFGDDIDGQYELSAIFSATRVDSGAEEDTRNVKVSIFNTEEYGPIVSFVFVSEDGNLDEYINFIRKDEIYEMNVKSGDIKTQYGLIVLEDSDISHGLYLVDFNKYMDNRMAEELADIGITKEMIEENRAYFDEVLAEAKNQFGEDYEKMETGFNVKGFIKALYKGENDLECILTYEGIKYKFTITKDNYKEAFDSAWNYKKFLAPLKNKKDSNTAKENSSDIEDTSSEGFIYKAVYDKKLDDSDLEAISQLAIEGLPTGKTASQMIINEIYARHGYIFSNDEINDFFKKRGWYNGVSSNDGEVTSQFSQTEKDNIVILREGSANRDTAKSLDSVSSVDWNQAAEDSKYSLEQLTELKKGTINYINNEFGTDWTPVSESILVDKFANVLYTVEIKDSNGNEHTIDGSYDENGQAYFYNI